jgi:SWI/SNF-related matrix-associated actin-dependent regulator 1 of chromatin subfamily A
VSFQPPATGPVEGRRIVLRGQFFEIHFPYRPYITAALKDQIPGRRWHPKQCACGRSGCHSPGAFWTAPATEEAVASLLRFGQAFNFDLGELPRMTAHLKGREKMIELSQAEDAELVPVKSRSGFAPVPYQRAGIRYGLISKRCFLADEMGLGKTVQALLILRLADATPVVIVVKASLKENWYREVQEWWPGTMVQVLEGLDAKPRPVPVTIVNYDLLRVEHEINFQSIPHFPREVAIELRAQGLDTVEAVKKAKPARLAAVCGSNWASTVLKEAISPKPHKPRLVGLAARLKEMNPRAFIADECHRLKNPKAMRTKACTLLADGLEFRLLLTGSPVVNKPRDFKAQVLLLDRMKELFGGSSAFEQRFCGAGQDESGRWQADGAGELGTLNRILRGSCYVRRRKSQVMKQLPKPVPQHISVELSNRKEYDHAAQDLEGWLIEQGDPSAAERAGMAMQLARIETLKQLAARGMFEAVATWLEEFLEETEDQKILVFGTHIDVVHGYASRFNCPTITGDVPVKQRQLIVDQFQRDPRCRMVVMNMEAGGEGLNMTAAYYVAFVELPWSPITTEQCIARAYGRLSDAHGVTVYTFLGQDTIFEDIQDLLEEKAKIIEAATDGEPPKDAQVNIGRELIARIAARSGRTVIAKPAAAAPARPQQPRPGMLF